MLTNYYLKLQQILQDIKERFLANYSRERINEAPTYGLNEFSKVISKQMEYFSSNPEADKLKKVHGEIEQVKDVMVHNIERVLERGERIELLVDKTDNLNQQAFAFKKRSTALRRSMWWKNTKLLFLIGFVTLLGRIVEDDSPCLHKVYLAVTNVD
ncbi:3700_t:CDS:2, partial [Gigaspora rosea]